MPLLFYTKKPDYIVIGVLCYVEYINTIKVQQ